MRFVQFYSPAVAMILWPRRVRSLRLKVFTAYEYLERRFDARARTLAATLFLIQRGLAAGLTIYAPSLILSVLLGWNIHVTNLVTGALVVIYTTSGGSKAVSYTQFIQMLISPRLRLALLYIFNSLPRDHVRRRRRGGGERQAERVASPSISESLQLLVGLIGLSSSRSS